MQDQEEINDLPINEGIKENINDAVKIDIHDWILTSNIMDVRNLRINERIEEGINDAIKTCIHDY